MTRIGDSLYRNIDFAIEHDDEGEWHWAYYPKIGSGGVATQGTVKGTRESAIAACKAAIDEWLGPGSP